uniref:Uncharacterized protein n=1 Tax=Ananas comosus var. bracteatus TaxID=296719 RepID=A0A6V7PVM8_ANACO|nr:unnamed protein product [Ananas comosus var. bracteatus]
MLYFLIQKLYFLSKVILFERKLYSTYHPIIVLKRLLLAFLLTLICTSEAPFHSIKDGLKALFGIALYPLNRSVLVELGAMSALFSLVVILHSSRFTRSTVLCWSSPASCPHFSPSSSFCIRHNLPAQPPMLVKLGVVPALFSLIVIMHSKSFSVI